MFKIETIVVKKNAYKAAKELVEAQGKYRKIGSGAYGTVFGTKGSNVVYKVGEVDDNDGYLSYVRELASHKAHNPFTPKIYGVRIYEPEGYGSSYFVVAMERLAKGKGLCQVADWFEEQLCDNGNTANPAALSMLGIKMPKALLDALKILHRAYNRASYGDWDLHGGNFMLRGKQVVITDPLC